MLASPVLSCEVQQHPRVWNLLKVDPVKNSYRKMREANQGLRSPHMDVPSAHGSMHAALSLLCLCLSGFPVISNQNVMLYFS